MHAGTYHPSHNRLQDNSLSFEGFWDALQIWSTETFGPKSLRGPIGPLRHLKKEVDEAIAKPDDLMEYADMLFLVFDSCWRAGFTTEQLRVAVNEKLKINKARKWGPPSADQPTEHIREEA